jgi:hypothetical protein
MFYTDDTTTPVANTTTALQYQSYIRQFVTGHGNGLLLTSDREVTLIPDWPVYGQASRFFNISSEGFLDQSMPHNREENCQFLNKVIAEPVNGA